MSFRVSFLFCQDSNDNEPCIIFYKNEYNKYEIPTFEMPENEYDVDKFVLNKFKEITGVNAIDKKGNGWINLFLTGTIVFNKKYSFVYTCKIPPQIKIENSSKIKMSTLLNSEDIEKDYLNEIIYSFNNIIR